MGSLTSGEQRPCRHMRRGLSQHAFVGHPAEVAHQRGQLGWGTAADPTDRIRWTGQLAAHGRIVVTAAVGANVEKKKACHTK